MIDKGKKEKGKRKTWQWFIIAGLAVLTCFFLVRLFNLTILPIFADEAIYIRWSQVMRAEPTLRFLPLSDGKQPLFMWMTIPFLKVFSDPLVAGRMLSVLAGLGSLIGLWFLSKELFKNKWVSLAVVFSYSLTPFFVFFDRQALADSLLAMFFIWLAYFGLLLVRTFRLDLALISGMVLGLALITKSPAIFIALLMPVGLLMGKGLELKKNFWRIIGLGAVIYSLGFGIYNFLLRLGPNFQMIAIRNKDYLFTFKEILSHPLDPFKPHLGDLANWLPNLLTWPILLLVIIGVIIALKEKTKESIFLLAWFIVPILAQSFFAKVFTPRYILFTLWPLIIFAGFAFNWLFNQFSYLKKRLNNNLRLGIIVVFVFLVFSPSIKYNWLLLTSPERAPLPYNLRSGHLEEWTAGQGIKESALFLQEQAKNQNILVGTEGYFGTLPDGLQLYLEGNSKNIRVIGVGWPVSKVHQSLINSLVDNEVYLLVNKSRLNLLPEANGLKLIKEYPKAVWPDGHRDKLLLFQLDKNYWESQPKENLK